MVEKVFQRHIVERAKSMAGTVWEGHGEEPGRVQESVFQERGAKVSPDAPEEGLG